MPRTAIAEPMPPFSTPEEASAFTALDAFSTMKIGKAVRFRAIDFFVDGLPKHAEVWTEDGKVYLIHAASWVHEDGAMRCVQYLVAEISQHDLSRQGTRWVSLRDLFVQSARRLYQIDLREGGSVSPEVRRVDLRDAEEILPSRACYAEVVPPAHRRVFERGHLWPTDLCDALAQGGRLVPIQTMIGPMLALPGTHPEAVSRPVGQTDGCALPDIVSVSHHESFEGFTLSAFATGADGHTYYFRWCRRDAAYGNAFLAARVSPEDMAAYQAGQLGEQDLLGDRPLLTSTMTFPQARAVPKDELPPGFYPQDNFVIDRDDGAWVPDTPNSLLWDLRNAW